MPRISVRPTAATDLENGWYYLAQHNLKAADAWLDSMEDTFTTLLKSPYLGVERNTLMEGLRMLVIGKYSIFYYPDDLGISVIRVLHNARNINSLYFNQ